MKKILILLILLVIPALIFSQEENNGGGSGDIDKDFSIQGFAEIENYIFTDPDNSKWNKYEGHAKADVSLKKDSVNTRAVVHGYSCLAENSEGYCDDRINIQQLYITILFDKGDIQIGKSIYQWGTADTLNPTSYFNPFDLEEMLMKEKDELYRGVPAVSGKYMIGDFTLQGVFVPVFTPSKTASGSSPWSFTPAEITVENPLSPGTDMTLPIIFNQNGDELTGMNAVGYGAQFSGSTEYFDFALSLYNGPDRDLIVSSIIDTSDLLNPKVVMNPVYASVTSAGLSLSVPVGELVINAEGTYSYNKTSVTDIRETGELQSEKIKRGYIFYAAGVNYWLKDDNFRFTAEFIQGIHLKDRDIILKPFISDYAAASVEKKILNGKLAFELKGMFNVLSYDWMAQPRIAYEIDNTLIVEASGAIFDGKSDTLFGVYSENDLVSLKVKYLY
jgi:hypothetical protein